ncbi:pre-mRNA-processing ATP-dependent RNA helicase Prp5p [Trichomonascus vanleenenianus]|uniref:pre-mRNA-processing ATP-dependent RNA helicase Prp5p n=1 Tax=Trichomonascus vanleenenianus TaxID=2268995 RepID=UPI003ECB1F24
MIRGTTVAVVDMRRHDRDHYGSHNDRRYARREDERRGSNSRELSQEHRASRNNPEEKSASHPERTNEAPSEPAKAEDRARDSTISVEEKRRQRQQRMEEWKRKKQEAALKVQESTPESLDKESSATPVEASSTDSKPYSSSSAPKPDGLPNGRRMIKKPIKRLGSMFGEEDDKAEQAPKRRLMERTSRKESQSGTVSKMESTQDGKKDEEDPLDAFMAGIGNGQTNEDENRPLPELVMEERDEIEDAAPGESGKNGLENDAEELMAKLDKKKKKDIAIVDHSRVDYEPFRKNFYVEPQELATMTPEEVEMLRLELDGIKVRGVNVPKPAVKWSQFGIPAQSMQVIEKLGYEKPSAIQSQAIPAVMAGRDVIGVAKTGSGKTMAFLLPLFRHIKDQPPLRKGEGPIALIMTPTRELANQIHRECEHFLKPLGLRAVCAYGGAPLKDQIADMKRGTEIVVCTPGRMIDLLTANSGRVTNLRRVTYLVLDEADRMFDMGFEPQVMKIVRNVRPDRQTVLFSATFPRQMEALAKKILNKPVEIIVGARSMVGPEITQIVEVREAQTKFKRVLELLGQFFHENEGARALIFVDRQEEADDLWRGLLDRGYRGIPIHGGKDQVDRDAAISDFKKGYVPLLIATSVAARGLDVKDLKLVINYNAPNHMEDYVHRVGRTGRAGNTGTAVTFITPEEERSAADIAKVLKLSKCEVPPEVQKMADSFMEKVKAGKARISSKSGFKGKGLEKLDEARELARAKEREGYDENGERRATGAAGGDEPKTKSTTVAAALDSFAKYGISATATIRQGRESSSTRIQYGAAPDNHGPDSGYFHATLQINDFPQKARWKATNRAEIAKVIEEFSTSITTKGRYYPDGKTPGENDEPKLYILIEGESEWAVSGAYSALVQRLQEGIELQHTADSRAPSTRYSVV